MMRSNGGAAGAVVGISSSESHAKPAGAVETGSSSSSCSGEREAGVGFEDLRYFDIDNTPESADDAMRDGAGVTHAIRTGRPDAVGAALDKMGDNAGTVRALQNAPCGGLTSIMHAAWKGDIDAFNAVIVAMEARLTQAQLKDTLSATVSNGDESVITAAANGGSEALFDRAVHLFEGEVVKAIAQQRPCGRAVFLDAALNGGLHIFNSVVDILDTKLTRKKAVDIVLAAEKDGSPAILTVLARHNRKHVLGAWATVLSSKLPYLVVAEARTSSLAACVEDPKCCLGCVAVLLAHGADVSHKHLIHLTREFTLDKLNTCFIDVLSMVDNPFIPGMILSVAFDDAAPKASEREARTLRSLMETIDNVLLEVLERLPQTIKGFSGGIDGCEEIFEPEVSGVRARLFAGPLKLALHERQYTETVCVAPLVFEYISYRFVSGLPDMKDTKDVLGPPCRNAGELTRTPGNGRDYLYTDNLVSDSSLGRLIQGMGLTAAGADGCLARRTGWDRIFSGTMLPGAQFVAVGVLTKPSTYYGVAAMRMALDFVVHLAMLVLYTLVVLENDRGMLSTPEMILLFYAVAAIYQEISQMGTGLHEYWQDKWNWLDAFALTLIATGLSIRVAESSEWYGRAVFSVSAPLVFSRVLFYAQILRRQGLVIQMITIMIGELLHFSVVMGVIMVGFTIAFFAIFKEDEDNCGMIWLAIFKAMLGEVGIYDDLSDGSDYENVATLLLVAYLIIMTVMLLNLLIAVLSTEHARADENAVLEFRESKVRLIKLYRRVLEFDLLPAPFNLLQLAIALPFVVLDNIFKIDTHDDVERAVGRAVFWLVTGLVTIVLGWVLWIVSTPKAVTMAWSGTNYSGRSLATRVLRCSAVAPFHVFGATFCFFIFWAHSGIAGTISGVIRCLSYFKVKCWSVLTCRHIATAEVPGPMNCLSVLTCQRNGTVETSGPVGDDHGRDNNDHAISVVEMLRRATGGLCVREVWEYLEDPTTPTSPAMRRDEQNLPSTVSHIRLLRDQLEDSGRERTADLLARVGTFDDTMKSRVGGLEGRINDHFKKFEESVDTRIAKLERGVADSVGARLTKLEEKLDVLTRSLQST